MSTGIWILLVAVVVALAFGSYRAVSDGRFRGTHRVRGAVATDESRINRPGPMLRGPHSWVSGRRWCSSRPRSAHRVALLDECSSRPSARFREPTHVEVDAEQHLDVVRRFGIMRTPTTLVLDPRGQEVTRATGVPTREQVLAALAQAVD